MECDQCFYISLNKVFQTLKDPFNLLLIINGYNDEIILVKIIFFLKSHKKNIPLGKDSALLDYTTKHF